jgi:hypothetical protein
MWRALVLLSCTALLSGVASSAQTTLDLTPAADTTLFESSPNDNMGGWTHFAAGTTGDAADRTRNRGLLRFDLTGLPANATIVSASLTVVVTQIPGSGRRDSLFHLHRLLQNWGEGDKLGNRGFPADPGEATWNHQFAPELGGAGEAWSVPGAAPELDFSPEVSATTFVAGLGAYTFAATPALIADVQLWASNPEVNFGWLIVTEDEAVAKSARAFASRENTLEAPVLRVQFTTPPPRLLEPHLNGAEFRFHFEAQPAKAYRVEAASQLQPELWTSLTNFSAAPNPPLRTVSVPADGSTRFFRVVEE